MGIGRPASTRSSIGCASSALPWTRRRRSCWPVPARRRARHSGRPQVARCLIAAGHAGERRRRHAPPPGPRLPGLRAAPWARSVRGHRRRARRPGECPSWRTSPKRAPVAISCRNWPTVAWQAWRSTTAASTPPPWPIWRPWPPSWDSSHRRQRLPRRRRDLLPKPTPTLYVPDEDALAVYARLDRRRPARTHERDVMIAADPPPPRIRPGIRAVMPAFWVWTLGCQMNQSDSEEMAGQLLAVGCAQALQSMETADLDRHQHLRRARARRSRGDRPPGTAGPAQAGAAGDAGRAGRLRRS